MSLANMKYLCLIVSCLLHYVYTAQQNVTELSKKELSDLEDEVMEKCRDKHNVGEEIFSKLEAISQHKEELPSSKDFKCMLGCFAEEMGYAKDAQPQWETMVAVHKIEYEKEEDANKAIQVVETCKKSVPEKEEDICELGYSMATCYLLESEKLGLDLV